MILIVLAGMKNKGKTTILNKLIYELERSSSAHEVRYMPSSRHRKSTRIENLPNTHPPFKSSGKACFVDSQLIIGICPDGDNIKLLTKNGKYLAKHRCDIAFIPLRLRQERVYQTDPLAEALNQTLLENSGLVALKIDKEDAGRDSIRQNHFRDEYVNFLLQLWRRIRAEKANGLTELQIATALRSERISCDPLISLEAWSMNLTDR